MTFKTISRVRSIGGSLVVTIPKEVVREKSISEGELIELEVEKPRQNFFGSLKGIGSFTREDRMGDREL
jgi:antitoxin component of MazEF toxin-antitoxin module